MRDRICVASLRRLISATGLSRIGDAIRIFALTLWVYARTGHSGPAIAALTLAQALPAVAVGVSAGALVDRHSRRLILTRAAAAECLVTCLLILAVVLGNVVLAVALVAVGAALDTLETIAARTWLPSLVEPERLQSANAQWEVTEQVAFLFGPAAAAVLYATVGVQPALLIDAASFIALGAIAATIPLRLAQVAAQLPVAEPEAIDGDTRDPKAGGVAQASVVAGFRYVAVRPVLVLLMGSASLAALAAGINNTAMIFFITEALKRRPELLAALPTVNGIAQIAAGGAVIALARRQPLHLTLRAGAALMATGALMIAVAPSLTILVLGVVITSLGNAPLNIGLMTFEQQTVEVGMLGRVRGAQQSLGNGSFALGSILVGALVATSGPRSLLFVSLGANLLMWLLLEAGPVRSLR